MGIARRVLLGAGAAGGADGAMVAVVGFRVGCRAMWVLGFVFFGGVLLVLAAFLFFGGGALGYNFTEFCAFPDFS